MQPKISAADARRFGRLSAEDRLRVELRMAAEIAHLGRRRPRKSLLAQFERASETIAASPRTPTLATIKRMVNESR
jgi:hypothetical protein